MKRSDKFDETANQIIREAYRQDKGRNCALIAMDILRSRLDLQFTESDIARQAALLGLCQPRKTASWSSEEDSFLTENAGLSKTELVRSFRRKFDSHTTSAIVARIEHLGGIRILRKQTGFTAEELAQHLHVGKRTLETWTTTGSLHASRNGREWRYSKQDVKVFVAKYPELIDIHKIDKYWLIGILTHDLDTNDETGYINGTGATVCGASA